MSSSSHELPLSELGARLFAVRPSAAAAETSLPAFWARHRVDVADVERPIDRAVIGGVAADRIGWAFLAGYQAALCALVPSRDPARLGALCVTEAGGAHPRAVLSELHRAAAGGFTLSGHKRWSTTVPHVDALLVVARDGLDAEGRPRLRVAAIDARRPGVRFEAMPSPPFVPEIPHGEVFLESVAVADDELLPGDGYLRYVKPFRTIEDLHVNAGVLGYLLGAAGRHGARQSLSERILCAIVCVRGLAAEDPSAAAPHLALAGLLALVRPLVDELVAHLGSLSGADAAAEHARLLRDLALLAVAAKAREQRRVNAWALLDTESCADGGSSSPRST